MRTIFIFFLVLSFPHICLLSEENFLLFDNTTDEIIIEFGPHINERITPCSTFKIVLSLMGYDSGILKDKETPTWPFLEGYFDDIDSWKAPQNPESWMKNSCIWYSQILAGQLGIEKVQNYLQLLEYGNQDVSGGLNEPAWIGSSLKISPREQVIFIKKTIREEMPISSGAIQMTKSLVFLEEFSGGWKLFGKTGYGKNKHLEIGWFVGWVEKDENVFVFAYNIRDIKTCPAQRISRVKQLLAEKLSMAL